MSKIGAHLVGPSNVLERLFGLLIEIVQNRLKIFSLELREERIRLVQVLLVAVFVMFIGVLSIVVVTFTVIWALDPAYRLLGLAVASALYIVTTLILALVLVRRLKRLPAPFTDSIARLKKESE